jgi:hypothetical protein
MEKIAMEVGQQIVLILSILILAWFFIFSIYNRRRGIATYHWLRKGMEIIGEVNDESWIGSSSSGAKIIVGQANEPFKRFGGMFMLQPREILPKWIYYLFRGKQDEIYIKASLLKPPKQNLIVRQSGKKELKIITSPDQDPPYRLLETIAGFDIFYQGRENLSLFERLKNFLIQYQDNVLQISLKKETPHLELKLKRSGLTTEPAENFLYAIQNLVKE